jgi:uroporphyrinogen-III synthase
MPELKAVYARLDEFSHLIFTSKNGVKIFFSHLAQLNQVLQGKTVIAIGTVTAAHLSTIGFVPQSVAQEQTQEGVVQLLQTLSLDKASLLLPCSSLARPILAHWLTEKQVRFQACDLYDTVAQALEPKPDLDQVDEIVFTSPSTVRAFIEIFGSLPNDKQLTAVGPVTQRALAMSWKYDYTPAGLPLILPPPD